MSAKARNVSCTISKSPSRWRGPGRSASEATNVGLAVRRRGTGGRRASGAGVDAPQLLAPGEPGDQVVDHVGGERARQPGLDVALGAVVEQRPGRCRPGRRRGRGRRPTPAGRRARRCAARWRTARADDAVGQLDRVCRGGQVRGGMRPMRSTRLPTAVLRRLRRSRRDGPPSRVCQAVRMRSEPTTRLCVYCGSNAGASPAFGDAAQQLGSALAHRGIGLVYGGGHVGLMGIVADAALAAGGRGDRRDHRATRAGRGRPHRPDPAARSCRRCTSARRG